MIFSIVVNFAILGNVVRDELNHFELKETPTFLILIRSLFWNYLVQKVVVTVLRKNKIVGLIILF